jgi:tyrosyl-tRNA synthetase
MGVELEVNHQLRILTDGVAEILPEEAFRSKLQKSLEANQPLRVKLGIDPTTKYVHIGHMVPYRKLRQFQDLGHTAVLIIGDFTAMIGDPTGKNKERPGLTFDQVQANASDYCEQIFKVIDAHKAEIHYQSSWFNTATLKDTIEMASEFSVAHLLSHETFRSRLENGIRLSLHEFFYPLLQAWDSISINADIELGGMDQKFNILCGRDLQRGLKREPQIAMFLPLLPGTDGEKMSKSLGNSIAVLDSPEDIYGKVMSISDNLIPDFLRLASSLEEPVSEDPYTAKKAIAKNLVEIYHGKESAKTAEHFYNQTVSRKEVPLDIPSCALIPGSYNLIEILLREKFIATKSEGRRLVQQGGMRIEGDKVVSVDEQFRINVGESMVVQVGKRRWIRFHAI